MSSQRQVIAARLRWVGAAALLAFVGLYTIFIIAFSAWQERSLPVAWLLNLPEALFAFPLAALLWGGAAAWLSGWCLEHRR